MVRYCLLRVDIVAWLYRSLLSDTGNRRICERSRSVVVRRYLPFELS